MWPRIVEALLALWLIIAHFLLHATTVLDLISAVFILVLGLLSWIEKPAKAHLLHIVPIAILLYASYSYPDYRLPFAYQNMILSALTLLMFAILPNHVNDSPRSRG